jgi:glucose-6-phosphate 1-dehydrogenase
MPQPCTVVIFGASGDLTFRKLIPALYNIAADGDLPAALSVVGFARREKTDESFRKELEEAARKYSRQGVSDELWQSFGERIFYHQSEFGDLDGYKRLAQRLEELDAEHSTGGNHLFYLSVAPSEFGGILSKLAAVGLNKAKPGSWARVIVEKPFGKDLASAQELNRVVNEVFHESDTYRIDHYLGKETAQNLMVLRFANAIFEPLWNHRYIDHVQITGAEPLGVEGRGPYYDAAGATRDMVQNHLLQLLSLVAMEPPVELNADSIRDEKVKVIRALRPMSSEDVAQNVVRGQYTAGAISTKDVIGYRQEERVNPESMTETYVAIKLHVDNWRWADVPFYIRFGKRLAKGGTEIAVQFKNTPDVLFSRDETVGPNVLVIRIQPDEGISLRIRPSARRSVKIEPVKMDFTTAQASAKLLLKPTSVCSSTR